MGIEFLKCQVNDWKKCASTKQNIIEKEKYM